MTTSRFEVAQGVYGHFFFVLFFKRALRVAQSGSARGVVTSLGPRPRNPVARPRGDCRTTCLWTSFGPELFIFLAFSQSEAIQDFSRYLGWCPGGIYRKRALGLLQRAELARKQLRIKEMPTALFQAFVKQVIVTLEIHEPHRVVGVW